MIPALTGVLAASGGGVASSFESIQTYTIGSGGSAAVTFSTIPATFAHLQIRITLATGNTAGGNFFMSYNSDTTAANYVRHYLIGDGSTVNASGGDHPGAGTVVMYNPGGTYPSVAIIDQLDYANTNKYKTLRSLQGQDSNGSGYVFYTSGLWMNTNAISNIKFAYVSGNIPQYSSFALYGVKA